jgi:hypothetical protein
MAGRFLGTLYRTSNGAGWPYPSYEIEVRRAGGPVYARVLTYGQVLHMQARIRALIRKGRAVEWPACAGAGSWAFYAPEGV